LTVCKVAVFRLTLPRSELTSIGQNPFTGNSDCKRRFKVEKTLVNGVFMQKQARKAQNLP
jgi:hypothetical protein